MISWHLSHRIQVTFVMSINPMLYQDVNSCYMTVHGRQINSCASILMARYSKYQRNICLNVIHEPLTVVAAWILDPLLIRSSMAAILPFSQALCRAVCIYWFHTIQYKMSISLYLQGDQNSLVLSVIRAVVPARISAPSLRSSSMADMYPFSLVTWSTVYPNYY